MRGHSSDDQTLSSYDSNAREFAERYENCSGGISEWFNVAFPKHCKVLDVEAGSGRDLAFLLKGGWETIGIELSDVLIEAALRCHPELQGRISQDSLPGLSTIADQSYDGILYSAVLMHIPEEELFDGLSAGKIEWLLCRCGFRKIGIGQSDDALGRSERRWVTLLFSLELSHLDQASTDDLIVERIL